MSTTFPFIKTFAFAAGALLALGASALGAQELNSIVLTPVGQYDSGIFDDGAAEIVTYDAATSRLFMVNAADKTIDVLDISQPWAPVKVGAIDVTPFGDGANSVDLRDGVLAAAIEADPSQDPGVVAFFDTDGNVLARVTVGSLPDMLTFTPDGTKVLVANEGEPDGYCDGGVDPEGSVSIIDVSGGIAGLTQADVTTVGFTAFNGAAPEGVRIFGPGATVAQDLEPEYIAVSEDSSTAFVVLQENNALAVVDVASATVTALVPLGFKDHSRYWNAMDASNRDDAARIVPWPTRGMYQPDAIAAISRGPETYLFTANEGDARDYDCFSEEERVADLPLDPAAFPDLATLQDDAELGRLNSTTANGDADGDGLYEEIYSYGARSFSVWNSAGELVWDSGNAFELITAEAFPGDFNSGGAGTGSFDSRSDDKGPEPEGITLGFLRGRRYAFIGLERIGGVMVYDVTDPKRPAFVQYARNVGDDGRPIVGDTVDIAPEGLLFIPRGISPIHRALLVVANEVSGTVTLYSVKPRTEG